MNLEEKIRPYDRERAILAFRSRKRTVEEFTNKLQSEINKLDGFISELEDESGLGDFRMYDMGSNLACEHYKNTIKNMDIFRDKLSTNLKKLTMEEKV